MKQHKFKKVRGMNWGEGTRETEKLREREDEKGKRKSGKKRETNKE